MLFHISEESGIKLFEPRSSQYFPHPVVWAIDADHLRNYLLPRDCPRVTYYAGPETTPEDVDRFLGSSVPVVAVESGWLQRLRSCRLYCYHLPSETFECIDECAGYFVSRTSVAPMNAEVIDDAIAELLKRGTELRFVGSLWRFRDAIAASSLQFSFIRMRNALPRNDSPTGATAADNLNSPCPPDGK